MSQPPTPDQPPPPAQAVVPLQTLLLNFVKQSHDQLHDLIDGPLTNETHDLERRRVLAQHLVNMQKRTGRLLALVRWCQQNGSKLELLQQVFAPIDSKLQLFGIATASLQLIQRNVIESRLSSPYDLPTALHIAANSGDYKLLPAIIDRTVNPKLVEEESVLPADSSRISDTITRLNQQLRLKLLQTKLPKSTDATQKTVVKVNDGIASITVADEVTFGVSLRMSPQSEEKVLTDDERISWRLFELNVHVNRKHDDAEQPVKQQSIVNQRQLNTLIQHGNQLLYFNPMSPLTTLYSFLHKFCTSLTLDILHAQSQQLVVQHGRDVTVKYVKHEKLVVQYWSQCLDPSTLTSDSTAVGRAAHQPAPELRVIVDSQQQLTVEHAPALDASFVIDKQQLDLVSLLAYTRCAHASMLLLHVEAYLIRQFARPTKEVWLKRVQHPVHSDLIDALHVQIVAGHHILLRIANSSGNLLLSSAEVVPSDSELQRHITQLQQRIGQHPSALTQAVNVLTEHLSRVQLSSDINSMQPGVYIALPSVSARWPSSVQKPNDRLLYVQLLNIQSVYVAVATADCKQPAYNVWLLHVADRRVDACIDITDSHLPSHRKPLTALQQLLANLESRVQLMVLHAQLHIFKYNSSPQQAWEYALHPSWLPSEPSELQVTSLLDAAHSQTVQLVFKADRATSRKLASDASHAWMAMLVDDATAQTYKRMSALNAFDGNRTTQYAPRRTLVPCFEYQQVTPDSIAQLVDDIRISQLIMHIASEVEQFSLGHRQYWYTPADRALNGRVQPNDFYRIKRVSHTAVTLEYPKPELLRSMSSKHVQLTISVQDIESSLTPPPHVLQLGDRQAQLIVHFEPQSYPNRLPLQHLLNTYTVGNSSALPQFMQHVYHAHRFVPVLHHFMTLSSAIDRRSMISHPALSGKRFNTDTSVVPTVTLLSDTATVWRLVLKQEYKLKLDLYVENALYVVNDFNLDRSKAFTDEQVARFNKAIRLSGVPQLQPTHDKVQTNGISEHHANGHVVSQPPAAAAANVRFEPERLAQYIVRWYMGLGQQSVQATLHKIGGMEQRRQSLHVRFEREHLSKHPLTDVNVPVVKMQVLSDEKSAGTMRLTASQHTALQYVYTQTCVTAPYHKFALQQLLSLLNQPIQVLQVILEIFTHVVVSRHAQQTQHQQVQQQAANPTAHMNGNSDHSKLPVQCKLVCLLHCPPPLHWQYDQQSHVFYFLIAIQPFPDTAIPPHARPPNTNQYAMYYRDSLILPLAYSFEGGGRLQWWSVTTSRRSTPTKALQNADTLLAALKQYGSLENEHTTINAYMSALVRVPFVHLVSVTSDASDSLQKPTASAPAMNASQNPKNAIAGTSTSRSQVSTTS